MKTVKLTMAQALVRYLLKQKTIINGKKKPFIAGAFAIFGHGNVTCFGEALEAVKDEFPIWRGQNEQGMALAATAFTKAKKRKQIMLATSSVGPGATNMVTACGVAMANRLPLLVIAGDTFSSRLPDPVLQQVEHFNAPSTTVNDSFKAVTRYWDRITQPEQLMQTLPQMMGILTSPVNCGPVFLGLPQDIQAKAYHYPEIFFEERTWLIERFRADLESLQQAKKILEKAKTPIIIAGGGIRYSDAEETLTNFAKKHNIPVVETVAGKGSLLHNDPYFIGPIGTSGSWSANAIAKKADVVLAIGTRLQDFTTASWSVFSKQEDLKFISINTAHFDTLKHQAHSVVGDAKVTLAEFTNILGNFQIDNQWLKEAQEAKEKWLIYTKDLKKPTDDPLPTYAQVIGTVQSVAHKDDYVVAAAGGFPGELNINWESQSKSNFDCEYGFSCMGYEISGGWGAAMANHSQERDIFVFTGDGSYMMMNSDIYSSVLSGHKMIVIVCDNGGFAVINRLQIGQGGEEFNNLYKDCRVKDKWFPVNFTEHAKSQGAIVYKVSSLNELKDAVKNAKENTKTTVISIETHAYMWSDSRAWWEVGVPEVSKSDKILIARKNLEKEKEQQRPGV